jgi:hypothetical protein
MGKQADAKRARRRARAKQGQPKQAKPTMSTGPIYTEEQRAQLQRLIGPNTRVVIVARPERGARIMEELGHPPNVVIDSRVWET